MLKNAETAAYAEETARNANKAATEQQQAMIRKTNAAQYVEIKAKLIAVEEAETQVVMKRIASLTAERNAIMANAKATQSAFSIL